MPHNGWEELVKLAVEVVTVEDALSGDRRDTLEMYPPLAFVVALKELVIFGYLAAVATKSVARRFIVVAHPRSLRSLGCVRVF
jgi:hypothetical protein